MLKGKWMDLKVSQFVEILFKESRSLSYINSQQQGLIMPHLMNSLPTRWMARRMASTRPTAGSSCEQTMNWPHVPTFHPKKLHFSQCDSEIDLERPSTGACSFVNYPFLAPFPTPSLFSVSRGKSKYCTTYMLTDRWRCSNVYSNL